VTHGAGCGEDGRNEVVRHCLHRVGVLLLLEQDVVLNRVVTIAVGGDVGADDGNVDSESLAWAPDGGAGVLGDSIAEDAILLQHGLKLGPLQELVELVAHPVVMRDAIA
jgi:hypothetical protein